MKQSVYFRTMLKNKGIRTVELAEKIGIKETTLNKKIRGEINFTKKDINIILTELEMTYEELFRTNISVILVDDKQFLVSDATASEVIGIISGRNVV